MNEQAFLTEKVYLKCCKECGDDECKEACDKAAWYIDQKRLNKKFKALRYPQQDPTVKGGTLCLYLPNDKTLYISRQARVVLDWWQADEPAFVKRMIDLLQSFDGLQTMNDHRGKTVFSIRKISVNRAVYRWDKSPHPEEWGDTPHLQIDIAEFHGQLENGPSNLNGWAIAENQKILAPDSTEAKQA